MSWISVDSQTSTSGSQTQNSKMRKTHKEPRIGSDWDAIILRPILLGWHVEEQITNSRSSTTTFVREAKLHHRAQPSKIYIVFYEFNRRVLPGEPKFRVKAGRNVQPEEGLHSFNSLKPAIDYINFLVDSTNRWIEQINSPETIEEYEKNHPLPQ